ncbi:hypothetical protein LTR66_001092 [Elasticomyces elasticus]|nr:hypothetical protein LTR66_001092 [Elasticomyces elasticus]
MSKPALPVHIVRIENFSDGSSGRWPLDHTGFVQEKPSEYYLKTLGNLWMNERGESKPGIQYKLDKLPRGYAAFRKARTGPDTKIPLPIARSPKPVVEVIIGTDEEGTPDAYRRIVDKTRAAGDAGITGDFKEPLSMDWHAERLNLTELLDSYAAQARFIPRQGELVLFVRTIAADEEICFDDHSKAFKIWSTSSKQFIRHPKWEAGVVTQVPTEKLGIRDLVAEQDKVFQVNYSGFRVEAYPDPNDDREKPYSKQYKYVPLHHIRPFVFYKEFLQGIEEKDWHPTIQHARRVSSSFSLLAKTKYKGKWPTCSLFCRGIFLGPELLLVDDVVRLLPQRFGDYTYVSDIMKISAIKLKLINLDEVSRSDPEPMYTFCVHIIGQAFTSDPARSYNMAKLPIDPSSGLLPKRIDGYGDWYHLHDPATTFSVPFNRILGKCYEDEASLLWFPPSKAAQPTLAAANTTLSEPKTRDHTRQADLSAGLMGADEAHNFSVLTDKRIQALKREQRTWFWADHRIEQLDLWEVNGFPVGAKGQRGVYTKVRSDRSPKEYEWRDLVRPLVHGDTTRGAGETAEMEVADSAADELASVGGTMKESAAEQAPGIPGMRLAKSVLVTSALGDDGTDTDELARNGSANLAGRKRSRSVADGSSAGSSSSSASHSGGVPRREIVDLDSDADEDEEAAADQLVEELVEGIGLPHLEEEGEEEEALRAKKSRVAIVID